MAFAFARKVGDIMQQHVVSVTLEDRFDRVITILQAFNLSCVPVLDAAGRCFGVLSTNDAVQKSQEIKNPQAQSAWELCAYRALEVERDMPIETAVQLLIDNHVQHLVVKENGAVVGLVSPIDLAASVLVATRSATN